MTFYPGITAVSNKISVDIPKVESNFAHLKAVLAGQLKGWSDTVTTFGASMTYQPDSTEADQGAEGSGKSLKAYMDDVGVTKNATLRLVHTGVADTTTYQFKTSEVIQANFAVEVEKGALIDTDYSICDVGVALTWTNHSGSIYKIDQTISEPTAVYESGTALTKVADIAFITGASKWAWSGNKVYIWTSGGVDPDSLASGTLLATYTLAIEGSFVAGDYQVFQGYGTVTMAEDMMPYVNPTWFGASRNIDSAADRTLLWYETNSICKNTLATGTITFSLPICKEGMRYRFIRSVDQVVRIDPYGAEVIGGGGAGKYLQLDAQWTAVELEGITYGTAWGIFSSVGTTSFEA